MITVVVLIAKTSLPVERTVDLHQLLDETRQIELLSKIAGFKTSSGFAFLQSVDRPDDGTTYRIYGKTEGRDRYKPRFETSFPLPNDTKGNVVVVRVDRTGQPVSLSLKDLGGCVPDQQNDVQQNDVPNDVQQNEVQQNVQQDEVVEAKPKAASKKQGKRETKEKVKDKDKDDKKPKKKKETKSSYSIIHFNNNNENSENENKNNNSNSENTYDDVELVEEAFV